MRNKTMRRGLAWILSAATIMTSVPVSAEEIVLDTNVVSEDEAVAEEQNADADLEEEVVEDDADIESQVADDEEEAVVIDGTDEDSEVSSQIIEDGQTAATVETEDPYSYVYNGQEIAPVLAEGETVVDGTASAVNVGEYTVELMDAEGVTREQVWNITPAELTATCYYAEVVNDEEESTDADTEASEENANIEVAVEVTGFVEGEDETNAAGYVAPQYTQPATLEDAATMKAFGGEADNYTFVYADSVYVSEATKNQIATQDAAMLIGTYPSATGVNIVMLQVVSGNETISSQLAGGATLSVEEVTSGEEYDAVKGKLNEKYDNKVSKYGYLKFTATDANGDTIDLNDDQTYITNIMYQGIMQNVTNEPTAIYGVSKNDSGYTLADGMLNEGSQSFDSSNGSITLSGILKSADRIAIVADGDMNQLSAGTYTVTANLTVLQENNVVLPAQVYVGNPNFPPITPLSYNAKLVVDENGKMTVTIENFNEIFQLISIEDGDNIKILEKEYASCEPSDSIKALVGALIKYPIRHEQRINKLVLELGDTNGLYQFGACVQSPIILTEDKNMTMHLQVNFDECEKGFDDSKGTVKEYPLTDEATGVSVNVKTTDDAVAAKLDGASLSVKENTDENYNQMVRDRYYDGVLAYKLYDIAVKDKDGNDIDLSNQDNTETKIIAKTGYGENRFWKLNGLEMEKLRGVRTEGENAVYTNMNMVLGTFAIVDNTSATQYAVSRTIKDGMVVTLYQKQGKTQIGETITEDTDLKKMNMNTNVKKKDTSIGTVYYPVAVYSNSDENEVSDIDNTDRKLELSIPYESGKNYYLVTDDGEALKAEPLSASNHNSTYIALNVSEYAKGNKDGALEVGLVNAYNNKKASGDNLNCYVLVTDKKVAGTPITDKQYYNGRAKEITYSGKAQQMFKGGSNYVITSGSLEGTNAGAHVLEVKPEDGYCWADGTDGVKRISGTIQKHKLYVRVKSEAVLVGKNPKYELEYGYSTADYTGTVSAYNFVAGEDANNASGYVAPMVEKVDTSKAGDYEAVLTGGSADNYEITLINGTIHVRESQEQIVQVPELLTDTTYPLGSNSTTIYKLYVVPKDEKMIQTVKAFDTPDENAGYTLSGDVSSNVLGDHSIKATLKDGYVWADGTVQQKSYRYSLLQLIEKPVVKETVEYNGEVQSLFDEEMLNELKSGTGHWESVNTSNETSQYEASEIGEYKVRLRIRNGYCHSESGNTSELVYTWSIIPKQEKEVASTEVITANLSLKASDATAAGLTVLEGLTGSADGRAYLTNPSAPTADSNEDNDPEWKQTPPTTPVNGNATFITYTDGTMAVKVPVKNAVFTLQKLGTSDQVDADDVVLTKRDGNYKGKTNRIDSITIPVTAKTGSVVFKDCEVYPTLLMTGYTVPLTLTWGTEVVQEKTSISNAEVSGIVDATYTGSAITQPNLKVTLGGGLVTLTEGTDYTVSYSNNVNAGTATITITGIGNYKDSITRTFTIKVAQNNGNQNNGGQNNGTPQKGSQTINVKVGSKTYKYKNIQKKAASFTIGASASGSVSYKVTSTPKKGGKYISVNSKGKVTLKKKAPAGTYQITVFATATADKNAASRIVTVNVAKDKQKLTAKVSKKTVKATALKKATKITIKAKGKGKLTYKVTATPAGANKYISVTKKGKVTLKKGAPKGTYKIQVTAGETSKYAKAVKTVSITVK